MSKLPDPPKFYGDAHKMDNFRILCEKKFKLEPDTYLTDEHKVYYLRAMTTGKAHKYLSACSSEFHTSDDVFNALNRLVFRGSDPKTIAQNYIRHLKQDDMPFAEFRVDFESKIAATGYNEEAKKEMLIDRLNSVTWQLLRNEDIKDLTYNQLVKLLSKLVERADNFHEHYAMPEPMQNITPQPVVDYGFSPSWM